MKIAFIILVYKNPVQLRYLIESLIHKDHWFFIHIDKTKTIEPFLDELNKLEHANIIFIKRHRSYWASYKCVKVMIDGLKTSFQQKESFDYFIHLSGQDFPVTSVQQIHDKLKQSIPYSFYAHFSLPTINWNKGGRDRLNSCQFFVGQRRIICNDGSRNPLKKVIHFLWKQFVIANDKDTRFFGGEFYFILHRSAVEVFFSNLKNNDYLRKRLKYTLVPEEIYIPTILFQSNSFKIKNETLRYINWDTGTRSPKVLNEEDIPVIKNGDYLFARKFDLETDPAILSKLKQSLRMSSVVE